MDHASHSLTKRELDERLHHLVRTQKDGSDARVLDDAGTSYIVVQGDSVYYSGMTTMNGNRYPGIKRICK